MKTPRRQSVIILLFALTTPLLEAQTVSVWLTTDDRKALLQPQPDVIFTGEAIVSCVKGQYRQLSLAWA